MARSGSMAVSNTKEVTPRISASLYWSFTLFDYDDDVVGSMKQHFTARCSKFVFQEELCPKTKRYHLQGSISLKKKGRPLELFDKIMPGAHWEKSRSHWADNYCDKSPTATGNHKVKVGFPEPVKTIHKLREWQLAASEILDNRDDRSIHWIWDEAGGAGKTQLLRYWMVHRERTLFCRGGKASDLYNLIHEAAEEEIQWDCFVWDLPRENQGHVSWSALECIKDGLICNTKFKAKGYVFNPPTCIIFSNFLPATTHHLTEDRWHVWKIVDNKLEKYEDEIIELVVEERKPFIRRMWTDEDEKE